MNGYHSASWVNKLRRNGTLVLTDLDGTWSVNSRDVASEQELADRALARQLMKSKGVVSGAVTARTFGLTLSEEARLASFDGGFSEPAPLWHTDAQGLHTYVDLAQIPFFRDSLDWDLSASFGGGIMWRNGCGYATDLEYQWLLDHDYAGHNKEDRQSLLYNPLPWRAAALAFLSKACPEAKEDFSPLEFRGNYERRITNVAPLPYRIQLKYRGSGGLARMERLEETIHQRRTLGDQFALRVALVDESRISEDDPEQSEHTLYLIPWAARKEKMVNWIVSRACAAAAREVGNTRLFYAGDTLTDLRAGLYGGGDAETCFLLATGSRLAPYLINRRLTYGSKDLSFLWEGSGRMAPRLVPDTDNKGVYHFVHKIRGGRKNRVIIGDERYPGLTAPGSVRAFLSEFL